MFSYIWPIGLVVLSNVIYHVCAKSTPETMHPLKTELQRMADEVKEDHPGSDLILLAKALEIFVFISRE